MYKRKEVLVLLEQFLDSNCSKSHINHEKAELLLTILEANGIIDQHSYSISLE